jgi:multiple sugar transport system substrate-binding protein
MSPTTPRLRRWTSIALVAVLGATLAACTTEPEAPVSVIDVNADPESVTGTITVMRNAGEITEELIARFNEDFPNVTIDPIDVDPVRLRALQAAGDAPDIFRTDGPTIPSLVAQGLVYDLTEPLEASGFTSDTTFGVADLYIVEGRRYGIPNDWSPDFSIFVNNAAFEAAGLEVPDPSTPLSWEEISELAEQLTITDGAVTTQFGMGGAWDTFAPARVLSTAVEESGGTLYSEDQTSVEISSNPVALEALRFMADQQKNGFMRSPLNPSASWVGDEFTQGTIAMVSFGYWFNGFVNSGETAVGTEYTMLPAPYWNDESSRINPTITGTGYVMSADTDNPQAAWAFWNWYVADQGARDRATAGAGLPVLRENLSLLPQDTENNVQAFEVVSAEAEVSPALQFNRYYDDAVFTESYNKYLQEYIQGAITLEEMAEGIEADVNAAIQDGVQQVQ